MEVQVPSDEGGLIPMSLDAQINSALTKINAKFTQLKRDSLTRRDRDVLKDRLKFIWDEPSERPEGVTKWRKDRARRAYRELQDANEHLFLAVVLAIPPTECAKTNFDSVLEYLSRLGNYEPYRLHLSAADKRFCESTAAEEGFSGSRSYLSFMRALFPQTEEARREQKHSLYVGTSLTRKTEIEFAYSLIRLEDIPAFLDTIKQGIYTSQQVQKEAVQGLETSSAVTVFVTSGQKDGSCNIVIDRNVVLEAISKYRLSDLKL